MKLHLHAKTNPARALRGTLVAAAAAALLLCGCSSTPVPNEQLAVAEAAVQRANNSGTIASAPGELQIAIAKLAAAKQAVVREDHEGARRLADEAALDAQVADMRAQAVRSGKSAQETQDAARVLREELSRKAPR
jgi:ABC-type uncharacterized transport system auxiliary subunit